MRRHVWSMNIAYPTNPSVQRLDDCGGWKWFSLTCSALKCSCFRTSEAPPTKHPEAPPTKVKHPKAPPTEVKHQRPRPASLSACCRLSRRRLLSGGLKRKKEVVCVCVRACPRRTLGVWSHTPELITTFSSLSCCCEKQLSINLSVTPSIFISSINQLSWRKKWVH